MCGDDVLKVLQGLRFAPWSPIDGFNELVNFLLWVLDFVLTDSFPHNVNRKLSCLLQGRLQNPVLRRLKRSTQVGSRELFEVAPRKEYTFCIFLRLTFELLGEDFKHVSYLLDICGPNPGRFCLHHGSLGDGLQSVFVGVGTMWTPIVPEGDKNWAANRSS